MTQSQTARTTRCQTSRRRKPRRGVVLLVALGMLGLFSILTVTYIIFSTQSRATSVALVAHVNESPRPEDLIPQIVTQLLSGSADHRSAGYMNGVLEDLYGSDSVRLRVAHFRTDRASASSPPPLPPAEVLGELLGSLPGTYESGDAPSSTLFRFPLRFSRWNFDGSTVADTGDARTATALHVPEFAIGYNGLPLNGDNPTTVAVEPNDLNTREQYDDAYTGRVVTFLDGPLAGHPLRVIRSFGRDTNGAYTNGDPESILAHNLVVDLSELPTRQVEIAGELYDLWVVADRAPGALMYSAGPDGGPGRAFVDDDSAGGIDDLAEYGRIDTDDVGYRLLINGQIFNGNGVDAGFASGAFSAVAPTWSAQIDGTNPRGWIDPNLTSALQPNKRYLGRRFGATNDEGYDAADLENMFLAWQPVLRSSGINGFHGDATADALINQAIVPSFHRPALINYLMNQVIDFPGSTTPARTFAELDMSVTDDVTRLNILVGRLRRATLRPLPFRGNDYDLDGDDEFFDATPTFTGSNPTPILQQTLPRIPGTTTDYRNDVYSLARWLANGPWDVDNDGDGIPDSIWADFRLPTTVARDGTVLRPMVAVLMEDLDGKININYAGSYAQLNNSLFGIPNGMTTSPTTVDPNTLRTVPAAYRATNRGFGVGPAEIYPGFLFGHNMLTQTPATFLDSVFGRVLHSRYGGSANQLGAPGIDETNDLMGQMIHPGRAMVHNGFGNMGKPLDEYGRGAVDIDLQGNVRVQNLGSAVQASTPIMNGVTNGPYEVATEGPALGNDSPYAPDELVGVLERTNPARASYRNRLLELIGDTLEVAPAIDRVITTESRAQRVAEMSGYATGGGSLGSAVDYFVSLLESRMGAGNTAGIETALTKMLAVELRKGAKLNLNRRLGNGVNDNPTADVFTDNFSETNGQPSSESAFPMLPNANTARATYVPFNPSAIGDFADLTGPELLARNLYCLMFGLLRDRSAVGGNTDLLIPNFPYPANMNTGTGAERETANAYVAWRLAQWAVNVVDFRDMDAVNTRLRFDADPFDANGWDTAGGFETVWGHEECGLQITETIATHDKRTRDTTDDLGEGDAGGPGSEEPGREDTNNMNDPDANMDQIRIPEPSAFVEIFNSRPILPAPDVTGTTPQPTTHFPVEIYGLLRDDDNDINTPDVYVNDTRALLDLARVAGTGVNRSPVFRLVVGSPADGSQPHLNSPRFLSDPDRLKQNANDPFSAVPQAVVDQAKEEYQYTTDFETGGNGLLAFEKNTPANNRRINVNRVVWFANIDPTTLSATGRGGLDPERIYYNRSAAPAALAPGQYAVVAPREETRMGMKTTCNDTNNYEYDPSDQRFMFEQPGGWTFKYYNLAGTENAPNYYSDANNDYFSRDIVPIVAQANAPHENLPGPHAPGSRAAEWQAYYSAVAANERVDFGFNISGPLPDENYYKAPLGGAKLNTTAGPSGTDYPLFDAYYDAENGVGAPLDTPQDEIPASGKPLINRGWLSGGTHQDASTVFLQKLADPTRPYNGNSNPYLTVSTLAIDLHVFSGHQDLRDQVDVDGTGTMRGADQSTPPGSFDTELAFDTRRQIPDTSRDRALTVGGTLFKNRAPYSNRQNILRATGAAGAGTFFRNQLRSLGGGGYADQIGADLDGSPTAYPETLGYLNREWGPQRRHTAASPDELVGLPQNTAFAPLAWYDRDFASPYEITMVPACSTARLGSEMDLGTQADFSTLDPTENEQRRPFGHLLGFEHNYDSQTQLNNVLGSSPGFELIFDFVDTGPIYADDERWLDPRQTLAGGNAVFNRVTETLRPPFNNISLHRTPGKINVNTTPDYLQHDNINNATAYDAGEHPNEPETYAAASSGSPRNHARYSSSTLTGPKFSGNGSVYKSLAYGFSTAFELDSGEFDLDSGTFIPRGAGFSAYASTQDTPFGYNFKGFIESRTGFSQVAPTGGYLSPVTDLRNRFLFHQYPSRFAGMFGTAATATLPTVRQYLPMDTDGAPAAVRRSYDMTLMRPHPDLSLRLRATAPPATTYDLPTETFGGTTVRSQIISTPLFERPEPELHMDLRNYDHAPMFRFRNTAKLANLTTHHSNVFLVRLTVGYFQVDPQTGEVGAEYGVATNENDRVRSVFVIDRSIPVPYEEGQGHDATKTVLLQSLDQ